MITLTKSELVRILRIDVVISFLNNLYVDHVSEFALRNSRKGEIIETENIQYYRVERVIGTKRKDTKIR